jgi:hypothetical protein
MCDFAARLVDRVMPHVPVRQWVLTVPHGLRGKLAYDPGLTTVVLRQLITAVSSWLRGRSRRLGIVAAVTSKAGVVPILNTWACPLTPQPSTLRDHRRRST